VPVTVIVTRLVKPGREEDFEVWQDKIIQEASRLEGHLGASVIRPKDHENPEYVIIFKFDRYSNLRRWLCSEIRQRLLEESKSFAPDESKLQIVSGLESWFTLPEHTLQTPKKYKMALITTLVVFVLVNVINLLASPLLSSLPSLVQSVILTPVVCTIMTYWVMPAITQLFARWLYP
jgi:antibiotic biosynthesis monooxygenase (ABM) superfamily enzyme